MAKLWAVLKREYLERVRTKWFVIATVFGPVLFAALMFLPMLLASRSKASEDLARITIIDATGTPLGERVAVRIGGGESASPETIVRALPFTEVAAAESLATRQVMAKERTGYLVLDGNDLGRLTTRYAGRNASSPIDVERIERAVQRSVVALRLERNGVSPAVVDSATATTIALKSERITDRGRGGSGLVSFFFAFGIAFLLYMSIILYGQNVLRGVMEEKQTRVAEVVMSSVKPDTLLAGKVLGVGAVGLTQQVIWVLTTLALLELREPVMRQLGQPTMPLQLPDIGFGVALLLLAFFLLGFIFYSALFAAVGAMVNSDQEAQQAAQPVILLMFASIIFLNPILLNPQTTMATVVSILPFSAPIIMPLRLSLVPVPVWEIVASLVSVILACLIAVWFASRIYRVGMLMYGKRPSMRELARWVRYAG